jgi:TonB family protein
MAMTGLHRKFSVLLFAIMFIHAAFMVIKIKDQWKDISWSNPEEQKPIKVTFLENVATQATVFQHKKQIVQSEDSADNSKSDRAFLSDKDRHFDRQTMARKVDTFKDTGKGNATLTQVEQKATSKASLEQKKALKDLKLSDIGMRVDEIMPKEAPSRAPANASTKGRHNGNPLSEGLSSTNDYVQEVALGDFTQLNTVEYKYYGFFHRIRQKLEQFWGKSIKEKADTLFRSGRRLPASEDLITSLRITLNSKGEIIGVQILGTSGVKELDDAAIESFNQAGPFPNPPRDLLVNGKATIEWGFVIKS